MPKGRPKPGREGLFTKLERPFHDLEPISVALLAIFPRFALFNKGTSRIWKKILDLKAFISMLSWKVEKRFFWLFNRNFCNFKKKDWKIEINRKKKTFSEKVPPNSDALAVAWTPKSLAYPAAFTAPLLIIFQP